MLVFLQIMLQHSTGVGIVSSTFFGVCKNFFTALKLADMLWLSFFWFFVSLTREKHPSKPTRGEAFELLARWVKLYLHQLFFDVFGGFLNPFCFFLGGFLVSLTRETHASKPTRGEAYELLTRDNEVALAINFF